MAPAGDPARFGRVLLVWVVLVFSLNGVRWIVGFPWGMIAAAVEKGVERAEFQAKGETSDELVRKAIRSQRETFGFWSALAALEDLVIEPLVLAVRGLVVATLFTGVAALTGRVVQYDRALAECVWAQGFWVLGLAVRVVLLIALRRGEADVETSLAIFLPPGIYPAWAWLALRQLDVFALLGWLALARAGWRRGDANLIAAVLLCGFVGGLELGIRTGIGLLLGAAVRLSLV